MVVDEQELRRLVDECALALAANEARPLKTEFSIRFSDGFSLTTRSLDDVLKDENPTKRRIVGLRFTASLEVDVFGQTSVVCEFGSGRDQSGSDVAITGTDRQWIYVTFSHIEERLRRMKQWHPQTATVGLIVGVVGVGATFVFMNSLLKRYPLLWQPTTGDTGAFTPLGVLSLLAAFAAVGVVAALVARLFPNYVFRIGDGLTRHDRLLSLRSKLGWALLGACVLAPLVRAFGASVW